MPILCPAPVKTFSITVPKLCIPERIVPSPAFDKALFMLSITDIIPRFTAARIFSIEVAHVPPASFAAPVTFKTPFVPSENAVDTVLIKFCAEISPFESDFCTSACDLPVACA